MKKITLPSGTTISLSDEDEQALKDQFNPPVPPTEKTFEDYHKELFEGKESYYVNGRNIIGVLSGTSSIKENHNAIATEEEAKKIQVIIKMMAIANVENGEVNWKPKNGEKRFYPYYYQENKKLKVSPLHNSLEVLPQFKTREGAEECNRVLGDEMKVLLE